MERAFKFKYVNEIVGGFVFLALVIMLAGIFVAGRAQGWFEKKAVLRTIFDTDDGAFGLREGDEVRIRDTAAGNVGRIVPMQDGTMQTTYMIKDQFLMHLRKGSVAKIRKKFALAGDSIVEIQLGKGEPLKDGDFIESKKDEELMDKANKALTEIQNVVMPIMKEMTQVLANLNKITGDIEKGEGVAGSLLKDQELAKEVKKVVGNMNAVMLDARVAVKETKKLIKGVQKHWLWRKYMTKDTPPEILVPIGSIKDGLDEDIRGFKTELTEARTANDSESIARSAYNLAVCMLEEGNIQAVIPLIHESRAELKAMEKDTLCTYVLEAQAMRKNGKPREALTLAEEAGKMLSRSTEYGVALQCHVVMVDLLRENGNIAEARKAMKKVDSLKDRVESSVIKSVAAGGGARLCLAEDKPADAAGKFDCESDFLRDAGLYGKMAESLELAGKSYGLAKNYPLAADRYFRAGRSFFSAGDTEVAQKDMKQASEMAQFAGDIVLDERIKEFLKEMQDIQVDIN